MGGFFEKLFNISNQNYNHGIKKNQQISHLSDFTVFHILRWSNINQGKFRDFANHLSSICFKPDIEDERWDCLLDL